MTAWILAGVLFVLLLCVAYHAVELEAERDEARADLDDANACIAEWEVLHAQALVVQRDTYHHMRMRGDALVHALNGDPEYAMALVEEFTT